jgi:hypothetical protein
MILLLLFALSIACNSCENAGIHEAQVPKGGDGYLAKDTYLN